ncbi:MAG: epoxyqueuosine reductase QueH [Lentisphaerae bacterium]|nr:epoxyqueuosine reductase QueH [Lentisphaerota bacterium]
MTKKDYFIFQEENFMSKKLLLLHCCCAPCAGGCIEHPMLDEFEAEPAILYFSNSNLDTQDEFERRLECVRQLGEKYHIPVEVDPYDHRAWLEAVKGFESCPEGGSRCRKCFEFSLSRAAAAAGGKSCNFATTLTVSPRKSSAVLFEIGGAFDAFLPLNFKKQNGYLKGTQLAKELGFYRQNYCGCEFSKRDSGAGEMTPPPRTEPSES